MTASFRLISKALLSLTILLLIGWTQPVNAQFEGSITLTHRVADSDHSEGSITLLINKNRMKIADLESVGGYQAVGGVNSKGILVRLDKRDFVFMTDDQTALKISKDQLVSMYAMMNSMNAYTGSETQKTPEFNFEKTGQTRDIQGYRAEEFLITSSDQPGISYHAWVTSDLNINWGMLAENWGEGTASLFPNDIPLNKLIDRGGLPILVERKRDGRLLDWVECSTIDAQRVSVDQMSLPRGVRIMSLQDLMMQGFGG
jgi:hypothetical protein